MIKQILIPTLVTGTLMVGTTPAQAATVILDDFTDVIGNYQFVMPGMMDESTQTGLNVLGGSRTLDINVESGQAGIGVVPGMGLTWDNYGKSSASVLWDSNGAGLDENLSKYSGLSIMVASLDLDAEITFTLTDSTGNESSLSRSGLNGNTTESFLFQDFAKDSNFNYRDIQSVLLSLSGPEAVDATFQSIKFIPPGINPISESVPEPNTMLGILAVGGASLLVGRRKKLK